MSKKDYLGKDLDGLRSVHDSQFQGWFVPKRAEKWEIQVPKDNEDWSRRLKPRIGVQTVRNGRPRNIRTTIGQCPDTPSIPPERMAKLTYRSGKHRPAVDPFIVPHHRPRTTAPGEKEGNASRPCGTTRATRTTHPSDQEGLVPRPAESLDQYHPSGRTRRTNEKSLGHDRPDPADSRSSPDSRPNVPTDRPNGPVDPKPFLKPVSHISSPITLPTY
ncbi:unnamed protein product [Microthlaspi erraticum]|uniref:Uncharacterized protein n=1 Tax=Microthlaspi erraticum TaxID=1685480 RepID=A0A6D2KZR9_9BRAS|nr:unnamed protein product [Microthlaspi erraticum]